MNTAFTLEKKSYAKSFLLKYSMLAMLVTVSVTFSMSASASGLHVSQPKLVGDQFGFTEGPIWDEAHQSFLFSDIPNHKIYRVDTHGKVTLFDADSGYSNGLAIDKAGHVWATRHDRKLSFTVKNNGEKVIVAATYAGKPLNSPNDLILAKDGAVWFTDPPFGIQGYGPQKAKEEQPVRGIYRYKDGNFKLKSGTLKLPNGIAFSPDEQYLYVADTSDGWVYRYQVKSDDIHNPVRFVKVEKTGAEPMADGVEVDHEGRIYVAGPGGVGIFDAQGKQLKYIAINASHISNMALGGKHQNLLLVTAANQVLLFNIR